ERPRAARRVERPERPHRSMPACLFRSKKWLLLLLRDESRIPKAAEALQPTDLADPAYRAIFEALVQTGGLQGRSPDILGLTGPALDALQRLIGDPEELGDADRIFAELVGDLRAQTLFERKDALRRQLQSAGDGAVDVLRELTDVNRALHELGSELKGMGFKLSARYRRYLRANA